MGTRGPKPSAALDIAAISPVGQIEIYQRPDAPYDLTDEQAEEWRAIVSSLPADHFQRGNYALLGQLCRHVVAARRIAQWIEQSSNAKEIDRREFIELLKQQECETRAISALLRSMRLTQQSVMRSETTKQHPSRISNPWDFRGKNRK